MKAGRANIVSGRSKPALCAELQMHQAKHMVRSRSDLKLDCQYSGFEISEFLNLELGVRENRSDL